jgi:hypothetical protein
LVRDDQSPNLTSNDPIHQAQQALKVQPTADLFNPLIDDDAPHHTKLFRCFTLVGEFGLLGRTGYPQVHDRFPVRGSSAFPIPSLQHMDCYSDALGKRTYRVHVYTITYA